eukprot:3247460-Prymnesium_polylepis.1
MRGATRQMLKRTAACMGLSAGAGAFASAPAGALAGPPRINKEIHELEFSVSASLADKFGDWLPGYLKQLLELPGVRSRTLSRSASRRVLCPSSHSAC